MLRHHFSDNLLYPEKLHPDAIFDEERRLAKEVVMDYPAASRIDPCPVSGNKREEILFSKWGQQYAICPQTWSLSLASLPEREVLQQYFHRSSLAQYRASEEYQQMASRLRQGLWQSRWDWQELTIHRHLGKASVALAEWGGKFTGVIEMLDRTPSISTLGIIEPLPPLSETNAKETFDVICLYDAFQREVQPSGLLQRIKARLNPQGLLFVACRCGSGFDILTLREHSDSIFPFDHVCLPSPKGIRDILMKEGFEVLELTTPGLLDMPLLSTGRIPNDHYFQRFLVQALPEEQYEEFQLFLQKFLLSSHLRVVARKKDND
ncbi:MAG: methyltransferase domain-containing protein [Thermodesulfobacteriota bacterium]|nr:methyltransferase domain-containing protein [Thermodesulfobacteriota bacterium]